MHKTVGFQDFVQALTAAKQTESVPLIIIYGPSDYLRLRAWQAIRDHWQTRGDCETTTLQSKDISPQTLDDIFGQVNMFGNPTLYYLPETEKRQDLLSLFRNYAFPQSATNTLVVSLAQKSLTKPWQDFIQSSKAAVIPCMEPKGSELHPFILGMAKKHHLKLAGPTVKLLRDYVGDDLFQLENEIVKLGLQFHDAPQPPTADQISQALGVIRHDHVFELEKYLLARSTSAAQVLVTDLTRQGEKPLALLGIFAGHCRKKLRIWSQSKQSADAKHIASDLGLPPHVVQNYQNALQKSNAQHLVQSHRFCLQSDMQLKSNGPKETNVLGQLIFNLTRPS